MTENAIPQVFAFTQLQRFRQDRDLMAFDKSRPIAAHAIADSDSDDDDSDSDGELGVENKNQQNNTKRFVGGASARTQASQQ